MKKRLLIILLSTLFVMVICVMYSFNATKNDNKGVKQEQMNNNYEGKAFQDILTDALIEKQLNGTSVIEYITDKVGIDNIKELETGKYQVIYENRIYELKEKNGGNYEINNMGIVQDNK